MHVVADQLSDFMAFTHLFRYLRPKLNDYFVYEVDAGAPEDYNIIFKAMKVEDNEMVGEEYEILVAKEWVVENIDKILEKVTDEG